MDLVVVDGQGAGMGCALIQEVKNRFPALRVGGVGLNDYACEQLRQAGADQVQPLPEGMAMLASARVIAGGVGVLVPGALQGEVHAEVAQTIAQSEAVKVLIPLNRCRILVAGTKGQKMRDQILDAAQTIGTLLQKEKEGIGTACTKR